MRFTNRPTRASLAGAVLLAACAAQATPITYFGTDPNAGGTVPSNGSSVLARQKFEAQLAPGSLKVEGFESFTRGPVTAPLSVLGGAATLTPSGASGRIEDREVIQGTRTGRFNTTPNIPPGLGAWYETADSFTVVFTGLVSAFGFFGTDWADFSGVLGVELLNSDNSVADRFAVNTGVGISGSLSFFGFTDADRGYSGVRVNITQSGGTLDRMGFDDLLIGSLAVVNPPGNLPEPTTLALVGLSLAGLGFASRKKQR